MGIPRGTRLRHGCSGYVGGGPLPVEVFGAECDALVWRWSKGVPVSCLIAVTLCFLCVEWEECRVVMTGHEKRSRGRHWG